MQATCVLSDAVACELCTCPLVAFVASITLVGLQQRATKWQDGLFVVMHVWWCGKGLALTHERVVLRRCHQMVLWVAASHVA